MKHDRRYPHFVCIGAHKSGTTWLFKNLRSHSGICFNDVKEIGYFNSRGRNFWRVWGQPAWKNVLHNLLVPAIFRGHLAKAWSCFRYLFFRRTDSWYASLFRCCGERLTGDVTPAYSTLDEAEVEHVASIMPAARIIVLLRNPTERAWSHARMELANGRWPFSKFKGIAIEKVPFDVLRQHLDNFSSVLRSDYLRTLHNWGSHFPATQVFVGFFEEIEESPIELLNRVCAFLGIEPGSANGWPLARERILDQAPMKMPPEVARYLSRKYYFELKDLEECPLLGHRDYVKTWREEAERHLA